MTLIEFVTITEEKVKKELKNKQGLEDTSIITLKLQDPDAINTKVRYLLEASNKEGKKKCVSLNTYYKTYKEDIIKRVAEDEYLKGNIIKECYLSMLSYSVEITD